MGLMINTLELQDKLIANDKNPESEESGEDIGENTGEDTGEDTGKDTGEDTGKDTGEDTGENTGIGTTEAPAPAPVDTKPPTIFSNPWTYVILAVVAALAIWVVVEKIRKRKEPPVTQLGELTETEEEVPQSAPTAPTAPMAPEPKPGIQAGAMQHIGKREDQQDSYGMSALNNSPKGLMAVVADGMGGLSNGKLVSSTAVRCFLETHRDLPESRTPQELLLEAAIRTNAQINQMLRGAQRSGSTLVAALIRGNRLHYLTVGDSRIYLYRGGALIQLNREHIYQEELALRAVNRTVSLPQVTGDRQAHALTSYFGIGNLTHLDRNDIGVKLVSGDKILLASDGVFGTLTEEQMEQALELSAEQGVQRLKEMVLEANRPYQDNNTAVILEYR